MKPDRSNYEIWVTDWLDGKLNESQMTELRSFLEENPDLKEEIEMLPFLELKPVDAEFANKEVLARTAEDFSESQFEYLCIASLENDLTASQSDELMDIIGKDEGKKRIFEMVSRLKLRPANVAFPRKPVVKKLTIVRKALRLAAAGLTAAASVAILVAVYFFLRPQPEITRDRLAANTVRDTLVAGYNPAIHFPVEPTHNKSLKNPETPIRETRIKVSDNITAETVQVPEEAIQPDTSQFLMAPGNVAVSMPDHFKLGILPDLYSLTGYHPSKMPPSWDPYGRRSNVDRFIARFFHERIMKDRYAGDSPVGSHELAEAGVKGLNKLLGWEMILQQKPDSSGNSKSYLFSSRLVKINTPVRKISDIL